MNSLLTPASLDELVEAVCSTPRVLAVGARTKPRLSAVPGVALLSMTGLRGIIEYDPTEFTFTALAGTPVREIAAALAEKGQYLPFDPMLGDAGATLGGTVAAGLNGPGRFRYGGVRDFILGVRFVDGSGRLLRLGGKVVKNAAGFDLPKFFTGSLGRFGVLAEITFKVFPRPASTLTLRLPAEDAAGVTRILTAAASTRWELDALDASIDENAVFARLAGPAPAIDALAGEILARWPGRKLSLEEEQKTWSETAEVSWAHPGGVLVKVALTPAQWPALAALGRTLAGARLRAGNGGNAAFLSLPAPVDAPRLGEGLRALGVAALTLRGDAPLWPAGRDKPAIASAVKAALDPQNRFPSLDD
jgi:glycolate oxidase FAD binding subunit